MNRLMALLTVAVFAGIAVADIPPPPPPKGKKYVSVSSEVLLAKDVTGYVFVKQTGSGPGRPMFSYEKLDLSADKAKTVSTGGRRTYASVIAVPQDAAKEFKVDADLFAALEGNKVKGAHRVGVSSMATVSDTIKGDSVKWTYTITAIDPKGIKTKVEGEGYEPPPEKKANPADKPEENDSPEEASDDVPTANARGGVWIAGIAAFAAITLGGLWLVGRARRKV